MKKVISMVAVLVFSALMLFAAGKAAGDSDKDCINKCNDGQAACTDRAKAENKKLKKCNHDAVKCRKECKKKKEEKEKKEKKEKENKGKKKEDKPEKGKRQVI